MSSATAQASFRPVPRIALAESVRFRLMLTVHILFGSLVLVQSLYLVTCYITFDFYGALASPFFAWLRTFAGIMHLAYLPFFFGALLTVKLGLSHWEKRRSEHLIGGLLLAQLLAGVSLFFSHGATEYFASPLLLGPHQHTLGFASADVYWESLACLIPLGWICAVHIVGGLARQGREIAARHLPLIPFLAAGAATSLLYQVAAWLRMRGSGEALSFRTFVFSFTAHLALFVAAFLLIHSIRVVSRLLPNPRVAQFIFHSICCWLALALVLRKIVFGLLAFSSNFADWYALAFSLAVVLFGASIAVNLTERRTSRTALVASANHRSRGATRWVILGTALGCFAFSVRVSEIDWAHLLSSLAFVITAALALCFCLTLSATKPIRAAAILAVLVLCDVAGVAGIRAVLKHPTLGQAVEEYSTYDPSVFVIETLLKPALQDQKYLAWYAFLTEHASIRIPIHAPTVPLTASLKPAMGYKPHIFVLVIDALRRDYVSAYNSRVNFTPNLQRFAEDSVVFRHAYSSYAGTALASPSLFAGFQQINKTFPDPLSRENNLQLMTNVDGYDTYISHNSVVAGLTAGFPGIKRIDTEEFGSIVQQLEASLLQRKDPGHPIFFYAQPANVHTLYLAWHSSEIDNKPHPGFNDKYASAVEGVDRIFGSFVSFLKKQGLYEDSVIIVTADHGESLGEMGRTSHVANVTPEVFRISLTIHHPPRLRSTMVWNTDEVAKLRDIAPTLYYLLGHRPIKADPMLGHPLFTLTAAEQERQPVDHYLLMSSYQAVFGILSADRRKLFMTDAVLHRNAYYDLSTDPLALRNRATTAIVEQYQPVLRKDLEDIDKFYGVTEEQLAH